MPALKPDAADHTSASSSSVRSQILDAATRLFATKGYEATSTREIVEAAGVTKPMLYYYFQNKEGVARAILDSFTAPVYERLEQVLREAGNARELLVEVVWVHFESCQNHLDFSRFFYALLFGPDERTFGTSLEEATLRGHELRLHACQHAEAAGLVAPERELDLLMALNGMINIWVIAAIKREIPLSREVARGVVDLILDGIGRH
jgi:AcrR family transcriptional regulator